MYRELTHPLTMRIMALGRPPEEAERIAAVITVWVVLLCGLMGCPVSREKEPVVAGEEPSRPHCTPSPGSRIAGTCGIFPALAGTAGIPACALLK